jgi:4-carboxymuconolactone decarboxylase
MSRLAPLPKGSLSEEQRDTFEAMTNGPRGSAIVREDGSLTGPYNAWLYSPATGNAVQQLGAALRFHSALPPDLLELAIILTARDWTAQYEWWAHARLAAQAGLSTHIIDAVRERRRPHFADARQATIYDFCRELLDTRRVSQPTYNRAVELLGANGLVDLVSLLGYYALVAMTLNVFEVDLPAGATALPE